MKWYARDPHRFIEGTLELTIIEYAFYNKLIDHFYARDGDLPDNTPIVLCMLRCHGNTWRAVKEGLIAKGKLEIKNGKIIPNGVENVMKTAAKFSEKQSKNALKRWQKSEKHNEINESDKIWDSHVAKHTTPTPTPTEEKKRKYIKEKKPPSLKHPIPVEWQVPKRAIEIASELKLDYKPIEAQFRDYLSSTGKQYIDYDAAFCNFVRNAPKFNGAGNGQGRPRPFQDDSKSASRAAARLAEAARRGEFSFGPRPSLLPGESKSTVLVLPKGRGT
jgi:hypothetical protein